MESVHDLIRRPIRIAEMPEAICDAVHVERRMNSGSPKTGLESLSQRSTIWGRGVADYFQVISILASERRIV